MSTSLLEGTTRPPLRHGSYSQAHRKRQDTPMPSEAHLCELMERLGRRDDGFVALDAAWGLYRAAVDDGLVSADEHGQNTVGYWFGKLLNDGRAGFRSRHLGAHPVPPGVSWGSRELNDHSGFFLTSSGREDARETRRLPEEAAAQELIADVIASDPARSLPSSARDALEQHFESVRAALLRGEYAATIGAAKEFVESASKAALLMAGEPIDDKATLRQLYRRAIDASRTSSIPPSAADAAAAMSTTVARLAQLRNAEGSGHGRIAPSNADRADAHAAVRLAVAAAAYLFEGT